MGMDGESSSSCYKTTNRTRTRTSSKRWDEDEDEDKRFSKVPKLLLCNHKQVEVEMMKTKTKTKINLCLVLGGGQVRKGGHIDVLHRFFIMDPSSSTTTCSLISEINYKDLPGMFSTVSYESKLFFIGGDKKGTCGMPSSEAFFIDTAQSQFQFPYKRKAKAPLQELPPMVSGKSCPAVVSVDGKIYVLGTNIPCLTKPWAEVFDIASNTWSDLPFPPCREDLAPSFYAAACYVYHEKRNRIITICPSHYPSNNLLFFDITTHSWGFLPGMCDLGLALQSTLDATKRRYVVIDDHLLFICDNNKLFVISLVKPEAKVRVHGLEKATKSLRPTCDDALLEPSSFLSRLGNGLLCLVWPVYKHHNPIHVHCLTFRLDKTKHGKLHAVILSDTSFKVDDVDYFGDCLPITTTPAMSPSLSAV